MLKVEHIAKTFGTSKILRDVSLTLAPGEIVSVLGSSGSGKSTLIRCINGLEAIDGGQITVDGNDISIPKERAAARKICATVFQLFNLYPHLTVLENITLAPIEVLGQKPDQVNARAHELLKSVGLEERTQAFPAELSGGQKQRVGICRALAMKPQYLLLDEITSALDPEMTADILRILYELKSLNTSMLFVTHEIAFARKISDRICFLHGGKILADMRTDDFFSQAGGLSIPPIAKFISKFEEF